MLDLIDICNMHRVLFETSEGSTGLKDRVQGKGLADGSHSLVCIDELLAFSQCPPVLIVDIRHKFPCIVLS